MASEHNFSLISKYFTLSCSLCGQWLWVLIDWLDNDQIPLKSKKILSMVLHWECSVVKYSGMYQNCITQIQESEVSIGMQKKFRYSALL